MVEMAPNKIPGNSDTRWLAKIEAISVILSQWDVLRLHFQLASQAEGYYTAKQLFEMYNDKQNYLYLICMRQILKLVTAVNKLFQSQQADVTKLLDDLMQMFATLLQYVVIPAELAKCVVQDTPNFGFKHHLMPTKCIHFGYDFEMATNSVTPEHVVNVREQCKEFIVELLVQIQTRLGKNIQVLFTLKNLTPLLL
jgi:hypothetical protein